MFNIFNKKENRSTDSILKDIHDEIDRVISNDELSIEVVSLWRARIEDLYSYESKIFFARTMFSPAENVRLWEIEITQRRIDNIESILKST